MPRALALALLGACLGACANVAPWERSRLAHPSMTAAGESPGRAHRLAVQEGASGADATLASGCGCN